MPPADSAVNFCCALQLQHRQLVSVAQALMLTLAARRVVDPHSECCVAISDG